MASGRILLVGDNPFHGVSHFSQERARSRDSRVTHPEWAAGIVRESIEYGANGFMFSVSQTTLSILENLSPQTGLKYYAIIPAAADYVRLSSRLGMVGLAKYVAKQTLTSGNVAAISHGIRGLSFSDVTSLMKAYTGYELSRIKRVIKRGKLDALMLHELVTEMAVALNMDWLLEAYIKYLCRNDIKPGFETRNFAMLVRKLNSLGVDTSNIVITAPFNEPGFQMNPSRAECEQALGKLPGAEVIAMSVLASGRVSPEEARDYLRDITGLAGAVIGVSSKEQARETFRMFSFSA